MNKTKSNKEKSCRQVITPKSGNRTGRATPTLFGRVSGCVHFFGAGWSPSPFKGFEAVFGSFLRLFGGRKDKLDKEPGSLPRLSPGTSARSAGSYGGGSAASKMGSKMAEKQNSAVVIPQSLRP